ncbi:MAG: hypothetical protein ACRDP6_47340 [Actinoallomurus sp.]
MSTVGTDARERLIRYVAGFMGGERWEEFMLSAAESVDALLSEGCRGDLAEAAGLDDLLYTNDDMIRQRMDGYKAGKAAGRRETALKIADDLVIEMGKIQQRPDTTHHGLWIAEQLARSFTEESSEGQP